MVTEDTQKLNSLTYMNRISNERWGEAQTKDFYDVRAHDRQGLLMIFCLVVVIDNSALLCLGCFDRHLDGWTSYATQALERYGTDFTLMEKLIPGRKRRHFKNKFRRECKVGNGRVCPGHS